MQQPGTASSALCALHPTEAASAVCARCGSFMCLGCSERGTQVMCPRCRAFAAGGFPLTREDLQFSRVWDHAWASFSREWVMLSLASLILAMVIGAGSIVSSLLNRGLMSLAGVEINRSNPLATMTGFAVEMGLNLTVGTVVNLVVQSFATMGFLRVVMDALIGRKVDLARMFSLLPRLPSFLALQLVVVGVVQLPLYVMIGGVTFAAYRTLDLHSPDSLLSLSVFGAGVTTALLIIVYSLVTLPITFFAGPEFVVGNCTPLEAIRRAWRMADGLRISLVGYSLVVVAVAGLSALLCCIGLLPGMALVYAVLLTLFLAARDPSVGPASFD